jgi:hypothetical protein
MLLHKVPDGRFHFLQAPLFPTQGKHLHAENPGCARIINTSVRIQAAVSVMMP